MMQSVSKQLLEVLQETDRPETFCVSGPLPRLRPALEVKRLGPVSLPLQKRDAAALKKQSRQAPYGKGTKTVVDIDVRRVWEVDAGDVSVNHPKWPEMLRAIVNTVQKSLGLEQQRLRASLYKLLLYETGSFFLPHRDGEKLDGMVATLVVALPSHHEGGALIVRHEGQEDVIDFSPMSATELQYAAFYADCEHEIKPVTSGYRLALVYNLSLVKSKSTITAPSTHKPVAEAARLLRHWADTAMQSGDEKAPSKLAVLLDHQYTKAGLARDALKGADGAKASVLFEAARAVGWDASLALVTLWQSGLGESSDPRDYEYGRYSGYGRYGRRWHDDDHEDVVDEDDDDSGGVEYTMEEVYESSLTAQHFTGPDGSKLTFGVIPVRESEIVSATALDDAMPDDEHFEGFTGNAGMTLERWYHRAAVILWPTARRFDVLCEAGVPAAVGGLAQMIKGWKRATKVERAAQAQACVDFASKIIACWPERIFVPGHGRLREDVGHQPSLLQVLAALGNQALVSAAIRGVVARDVSFDIKEHLVALCKRHGWLVFEDDLRHLFASTTNDSIERHAAFLAELVGTKDEGRREAADRVALCTGLADELMAAVERWDPRAARKSYDAARVDLVELLPVLVKSFMVLGKDDLVDRLVQFIGSHPAAFDVSHVLVPAILGLAAWLKRRRACRSVAMARWLDSVVDTLERRVVDPPVKPADWRRSSVTRCACADCRSLSRFLDDATENELALPLAQRRRDHVADVIRNEALDLKCRTVRRGSPHTLVCKKTNASFERAQRAHDVDAEHLAKIREIREVLQG